MNCLLCNKECENPFCSKECEAIKNLLDKIDEICLNEEPIINLLVVKG